MAIQKLILRPGINVDATPTLNEGGWSLSGYLRWRDGLPEKLGGWQRINYEPFTGVCRGMHAWQDLSGLQYLAVGTDQRLQIIQDGAVTDITPSRRTVDDFTPMTVTAGSPTVTITDIGNGAAVGDEVNVVTPTSVGGIFLQGYYPVVTVIDDNSYTITAPTSATTGDEGYAGALPVAAGTGYVPGDTIVAAGGTYTTQAALAVYRTQVVGQTIATPGTGYTPNDTVTAAGGTFDTAAVYTVSSTKVISAATQLFGSGYAPTDTITASGGVFITPAVFTVANTQVISASVAAAGSGGTNGTQIVTGTTGTGTKFTASVTVSGGSITAVLSILTGGIYTVNPTTLTAEPVTGAGLTGAQLIIVMGVNTVTLTTPGSYTTNASLFNQGSTSGTGVGATISNIVYGVNTVNITASGAYISNSSTFTQGATSGAGTGVTFSSVIYGVGSLSVRVPGMYSVTPTNPAAQASTSGSGTGLTITGTYGQATTASFTTTASSSTVTVYLTNHGLAAGSVFDIPLTVSVGGLSLSGEYVIVTVATNSFTINSPTAATYNAVANENGGKIELAYLLAPGATSSSSSPGYGGGGYGDGPYGIGTGAVTISLRQWSLDNFGAYLVGGPKDGGLYYWVPPVTSSGPAAIPIPNAPSYSTASFVAMPEQQIIALGAETAGEQDPLLVRWCDVGDFTDWTATVTNQAGSFRLSNGSRIVGGLQAAQQGFIWTDLDLWAMNYIQPPLVYGFNKVGSGCGLIAMRAAAQIGSVIVWMSQRRFFIGGSSGVQELPCPIWDQIFQNLDLSQVDKICAAPNSMFGEVAWHYPSLSGNGENDSYVKVQINTGLWDYGSLVRTAWIDQSVLGAPIGADTNSLAQQHEISANADGAVLNGLVQSGYIDVSAGEPFVYVDQIIPDFELSEGTTVLVTVLMQDYPGDTPRSYGPYPVTSTTEYISTRARGRQMAIQIQNLDLGSFWRIGAIRYRGAIDGRR